MASWLHRQASGQQAQLIATAFVSGAVVACTIFGIQALRRRVATDELKASIPNINEHYQAQTVSLVSLSH